MEKRILECRTGKASTEYILPFFWQHGEELSILKEEIDAIQKCGITEFCVESRTHEEFCRGKWWEDFGFILKEARKRKMRVWLLDDKRFPTGYANNYIEEHPELRAVRIRMVFRDFAGPQADAALIPVFIGKDESFVSIVAYRRTKKGDILTGEGIELNSKIQDGLIWWDIPEGIWRVCYIIRTHKTCVAAKQNYIDMMSEKSCRAMLHAVYEPHYEHFKEYFGNTFAGFFSDEPGFANDGGHYNATLGREDVPIPWNDKLPEVLKEKTGLSEEEVLKRLPALFHEIEGVTPLIRETYMEAATESYSKNFSWLLGDWCRAHGVMYIGHVIEDQNSHQRLGYSAGHFFRSLDGQDMAGCDIVLHQIIPGQAELEHTASLSGHRADPAFFNYTLAKLASSHAHIQPLKKGRAMCEVYGAFGWAEGIPEMKFLTDLMLVSGINYFVPHAFTPKYPDHDCPPHFYARGMNPQYPLFGELMGYMKRTAHALTGGVHQADVAVYYNAEAEWAGGKRMLQQEICKVLTRSQIDFDLIPQDTICRTVCVKKGRLAVNEETYGALIVPYSQYLPKKVIKRFEVLAAEGLPVWYVDGYPETAVEDVAHCKVVTLTELTKECAKQGLKHVKVSTECPSLRFFHTKRGVSDVIMLWNEDIFVEIDVQVTFGAEGSKVFYDAWNNRVYQPEQQGNSVRVLLKPAQAILVCCDEWDEALSPYDYGDGQIKELSLTWKVGICPAGKQEFSNYPLTELHNLSVELPYFGGVIRYEAVWNTCEPEKYRTISLTTVGETAQLWVNGEYCGSVVARPYRFEIDGKLKSGKNHLRIDVMSSLGYRERDELSSYLPLPPTGLVGNILVG